MAGWLYFTTNPASTIQRIANKSDTNKREWEFLFNLSQLQWYVFDGTASVVGNANSTASISAGTWYFVVCWHDTANNQVGIQVNNGTATTASSGAAGSNSGPLYFGNRAQLDAGSYLNGRLDEWGLWKRLLTATEKTYLYNAGSGQTLYAAMRDFWFPGIRYAERDFGFRMAS